jgi:group I intron endonuclease
VTYIIYCHTNLLTGKRYVGLTKRDMMEQWEKRHVANASRETRFHLSHAIRLYGAGDDVWKHEILQSGLLTKSDANVAEMYWIKHFRSHEPEFGYNMTLGGDGSPGYKHTEEQRRVKSERQRGKKRGPYQQSASESKRGKGNPMFGKHHSDEHKKFMSETLKGRPSALKGRSWSAKRRATQEAKSHHENSHG